MRANIHGRTWLTFEVITGANFMSDYDVILDVAEKYLKMKQDEVIRRHEFFYNTVLKNRKRN
jgi:hypothetical protein